MDKSVSLKQQEYIHTIAKRKKSVFYIRILILIGFFALWEICARLNILDPFIFSSPYRIFHCFLSMTKDGSIFYHTMSTVCNSGRNPYGCLTLVKSKLIRNF